MNTRLEFYRGLQAISDTVQAYKEHADDSLDLRALELATKEEEKAERQVAGHRTKRRFLEHLRAEGGKEQQRICVICQCDFESGVLTVCGHQYCKDCITEWWSAHRTCPLCKTSLRLVDFHDITYKPQEITATEERHPSSPESHRTTSATGESSESKAEPSTIYSQISAENLNQIKSIDLSTSFGTKIDTLGRHLLWLREVDPGAKSIIFSQFSEFLDVLRAALTSMKIGHASITEPRGIDNFRHGPSVECFLLDAKSDSSGLNLVNATHVFLCEPLVNPGIELQAIARVHRIGQMRATTVWMSLISDSVEEAVYDLSVGRRLAHIAKRQKARDDDDGEAQAGAAEEDEDDDEEKEKEKKEEEEDGASALEAFNSAELQKAPLAKLLVKGSRKSGLGGEMVHQDDLWTCLFSKSGMGTRVNEELRREMGRHERAEAAEGRMDNGVSE
jgi:E3 ubiquitin-protein ligase SHPRH